MGDYLLPCVGDILAGALDAALSGAPSCCLCFYDYVRKVGIMLLFGYMSPWDVASCVAPRTNTGPLILRKSAAEAPRA